MGPTVQIPSLITALHIFAVLNLTALLNITLVEANILVLDSQNKTRDKIADRVARFGGDFPTNGLWGKLKETSPQSACTTVLKPETDNTTWIALIRRNDCDFDVKVLNAQNAGFKAAVVYDPTSNDLVPMGAGKVASKVTIPSAFIGSSDAKKLRERYPSSLGFTIVIDDSFMPLNPNMYLLPFAIVVGICFLLMLAFMIAKWVHDIRKKRKSRLSKQHLKKIPIKKFKKGDEYDVCAICLDEYEEGEKLRILPCAHAYHQVCVDPWLTKNKRVCPLCKKRVIPGDETDSESDSDSDGSTEGATGGENTPLLATSDNQQSRSNSAYNSSGLPSGLHEDLAALSDSSSDTTGPDSLNYSTYQSSVEVHQPNLRCSSIQNGGHHPSLHVELHGDTSSSSGSYGSLDTNPLLVPQFNAASKPNPTPSPHTEEDKEREEGAFGGPGLGVDNIAVDILEDYYRTEHESATASQLARSAEQATEVLEASDADLTTTHGKRYRRRSYEEIV